jgi:group I intron endonuclease
MGYIYKITNTKNKKCYIGETQELDVQKIWKGHLKSIKRNKGCPALIGAINKYGLESFKFEVVIICFDEDRFNYEREYIKKYNSQAPYGYNILPGGEGGGFLGKSHSEESREKISENLKKFNKNNPGHFETFRKKWEESMSKVDISAAIRKSEKFKKAKEEKRVGSPSHKNGMTEETKENISKGLKRYYEKGGKSVSINIEKHRESMAKAVCKKLDNIV